MPACVLAVGSGNGGICAALYTLPKISGRSGSPSKNDTTTS
jgi:hypothetical protein